MIDLHYWSTPNGHKITMFLEETGLPYRIFPVNIGKGEQFKPEFLAIAPNNRIPAMVDHEPKGGGKPISIFESGAMLLYLAEKTGKFLPARASDRGPMLSWLMFVASGIGPYSGQAVHFRNFAPEPKEYAVDRYTFEAQRHWGILEARLAGQQWMVGNDYGIVDMAVWGWSRLIPFVLGQEAPKQFPNLQRHLAEINARPAAQRALALKDRHTFKAEMDEAARLAMFPHLAKKVA